MEIALVHDHYEQAHLYRVVEEMKTLGTPTLKAVWMECWGIWCALEGCHRLRAAAILGITPEIEEVPFDDTTTVLELGLDYQDDFRVCEIVDGAYARHTIRFED